MSRFDIATGYWLFYHDWESGGDHPKPTRRSCSYGIGWQLSRMKFLPSCHEDTWETIGSSAQEVYRSLCTRFGYPVPV